MGKKTYENPLDCPVTRAVSFIGGRWKPIILYSLTGGSLRFGQLAAYIPTISRKMLTEQLRELERDGLVTRTAYAEIPPRVEYALSEIGKTVIPVMNVMCEWGKTTAVELEALKTS
ncbi:MAG: helix-turn-helix domain-containing protein [Bacteroidota bacterium]